MLSCSVCWFVLCRLPADGNTDLQLLLRQPRLMTDHVGPPAEGGTAGLANTASTLKVENFLAEKDFSRFKVQPTPPMVPTSCRGWRSVRG